MKRNDNSDASPDETRAPEGERAFKMIVEYDGANFAGWQRQAEGIRTLQGTLEKALERIVLHPVRCDGAGRTDTGVHALGQVARIRTTAPHVTVDSLLRGGNTHLPEDLRIRSVEPCDPAFDPRRDARLRWYRYSIPHQPVAPALGRHRVHHVSYPLDWDLLEQGLERLRGEHDFNAFRAAACLANRTVLDLREARHIDEHPLHHLDFRCRSYLHNMIRLMTGLLIDIARGRLPVETIDEFFRERRRTKPFRNAPASGLVLMEVDYGEIED